MKLSWTYDYDTCTVVERPADSLASNGHWLTAEEAWEALWREALADVSLAAGEVRGARAALSAAEKRAADAAVSLATARRNREKATGRET